MSAPHSTGACALFLEEHPSLTSKQIVSYLHNSATADSFVTSAGTPPNYTWGYGKLNIYTALMAIMPHTPVNTSPADGVTGLTATPTLTASAFSDPVPGTTHLASQWQIRIFGGTYTSPIYDSGDDIHDLTSINIPSGHLTAGNTYYWHVQYEDSNDNWSLPSVETSFTVGTPVPQTPVNISPANGTTGLTETPTLTASAFSEPVPGATQRASEWQITTTSGNYSSPVWDLTSSTDLTSAAVPSGILSYSNTYYWHVRYQDNNNIWSSYSSETYFIVEAQPSSGGGGGGGGSVGPFAAGLSGLLVLIKSLKKKP